jgi:hypothetical protein
MITNADEHSSEVLARMREAGQENVKEIRLALTWPEGVYALSHVSLPFSPDDPLYGSKYASPGAHGLNLGALELRGETNLLHIPVGALMRLRYNPFFP